ncbi:CheR family methyltransferase [Marinobacter sp. ELB17]|uniref:CheR family methyltransferase n=1 Tax=Marinobacter sp. ELB17 TaxID=270374 RepID=UPI0000F36B3F|nr:protein-glutamate O-methyltransferase CheR [Marinobacter sp. ELB17]EBA01460.1 Methylase of chemotaxis methyl-accepting protein [Marinobacter sp. ELB17]
MANAPGNQAAMSGRWTPQRFTAMDDAQFDQWQTLLEQRTGMALASARRSFLETNLGIRMRELGYSSYQDYYQAVVCGSGAIREWASLVDRLTVHETRFFRDPDACQMVANYVNGHSREQLTQRPLEAWSVGCSSGEEPYTLAMVLADCLQQRDVEPLFGITASDISPVVLEKARRGYFNLRRLEGMKPEFQARYFSPIDSKQVQICSSLRERVCFNCLNVLDLESAPTHGMNIIFCQNLLIYFHRWRRQEIVRHLAERLAPGGLLILGQGELSKWHPPGLQRVPSGHVLAWTKRQTDDE